MNINMERRLTLKRYFGYLIHYLWACVLLAALFGGMLGTYKYMSDRSEAENSAVEYEDNQDEAMKAYSRLSAEEVNNVEIAISYYEQMVEYNNYFNNSIYISQDPYNLNRTTYLYTVDLKNYRGTEIERPTIVSDIMGAYIYYITRGDFITSLAEETGIEAQYVGELISATTGTDTLDGYFVVSIIDDERIGDIRQQVEELISDYKVDLGDGSISYTVNLVDVYKNTLVDDTIISANQSMQANLYNASTRLVSLKKAFSDDQSMYYTYRVHEIQSKSGKAPVIADIEDVKVDIRFVVVGLIVGIVFYCAIVLFMQMQSAHVLDTFEFTDMFGLRFMGAVTNNKNGNSHISLLKKITYGDDLRMSYEDSLSFVALKLKLACKAEAVDKLALISSDFSMISEDRLKDLVSRLEKEGINTVKLDPILTNGENMERLFEINKCIVLEQTGKSRVKSLAKLMNFCAENGMGVYGVVDFVN